MPRSLPALLLALLALPSRAQLPPAPAVAAGGPDLPPLRVVVTGVQETRPTPTRPGSTRVSVAIAAEGLLTFTTLSEIGITKAEDSLGRPIPAGISPGPIRLAAAATAAFTADLSLGAVPREADRIKFIEGVIVLAVQPTVQQALVKVTDPAAHPGPVRSPTLAMFGIELRLFSDQAGLDRLAAETGLKVTPPASPPFVGFYLRDPNQRVQGAALINAAGLALPQEETKVGEPETGALYCYTFPRALPPGAALVVNLTSDPIRKSVPFRVEDIALP